MNKVQFDTNGGCWLWAANVVRRYGMFSIKNVSYRAHRVSYELMVGPIGDSFVLHRCDVPLCVNPNHLFLGTHQENMDDMKAKGRHWAPKGEAHGGARLTDEDVREIRSSSEASRKTAKRFGVDPSLIRQIRRGVIWKHIAQEQESDKAAINEGRF